MEVAGLVLASIELTTRTIHFIYRYVNEVKDADDARHRLLHELHAINGILQFVRPQLDSSPTGDPALASLGADCGPSLAEYKKTIEDLSNDLLADSKKSRLPRILTWPIQRRSADKILLKLERYKTTFTLAFSGMARFVDHAAAMCVCTFWSDYDSFRATNTEAITGTILTELRSFKSEWTQKDDYGRTDKILKDILDELKPIDHTTRHSNLVRKRQDGTCQWIFSHSTFLEWKTEKGGVLWLHGTAGSGKSTLASAVIEDGESASNPVVYHYCHYQQPATLDVSSILRTILAQLLRVVSTLRCRRLGNELDDILTKIQRDGVSLVTRLLLHIILVLSCELCPKPLLLVIDGLNECSKETSNEMVDHLLTISKRGANVLVTSCAAHTSHIDFERMLSMSLTAERSHVDSDIEHRIVRSLAKKGTRLNSFAQLEDINIQDSLLSKANGMFQWVECQLDSLQKCPTKGDVKRALASLPGSMEATYVRMLESIQGEFSGSDIPRTILRWVVGAKRPLSGRELREAVMIEIGRRELNDDLDIFDVGWIVDSCRLLTYCDAGAGGEPGEELEVTLVHSTVKEYLLKESWFSDTIPESRRNLDVDLAMRCLTYLSLDTLAMRDSPKFDTQGEPAEATAERLRKHPFYGYATEFCADHLSRVTDPDSELRDLVEIVHDRMKKLGETEVAQRLRKFRDDSVSGEAVAPVLRHRHTLLSRKAADPLNMWLRSGRTPSRSLDGCEQFEVKRFRDQLRSLQRTQDDMEDASLTAQQQVELPELRMLCSHGRSPSFLPKLPSRLLRERPLKASDRIALATVLLSVAPDMDEITNTCRMLYHIDSY
ncbi:hypothetical protein GGG16DRAFT_109341 [Schizophyllum commune]